MKQRPLSFSLRTLVPAFVMSIGALALVGTFLYLSHPTPAQANTGDLNYVIARYPQINNSRLDSCSLCHTNSIPGLNSYGAAYKAAGRNAAALAAIEALDSDGDGFTNLQEINALTFPGNANDHPAAAATATNTALPTNTATKAPAPTSTPTTLPTNPPAPSSTPTTVPPTNTPTQAPLPTDTPTVPAPTATLPAYPGPIATGTLPAYPGPGVTPTTPPTSQPTQEPPTPTAPPPTATPAPTDTPAPTVVPSPEPTSGTLTLAPVADAYVSSQEATHNYGAALSLKVVSRPLSRSYLRFQVPALNGAGVQRAILHLYVDSASGKGFDVLRVSDNGWVEGTITYRNAPRTGSRVASFSSRVPTGQWIDVDVTALVRGGGTYSLALVAHSSSNATFASRESGAHAPVLNVTLGSSSGGRDDHVGARMLDD
jgi:hypothetical protein